MKETDSLTNLLKAYNAGISAVKANKILLKLGILEVRERISTKDPGRVKKFKVLTSEGLRYGINRENLSNPEETSPYYSIVNFPVLLELILSNQ